MNLDSLEIIIKTRRFLIKLIKLKGINEEEKAKQTDTVHVQHLFISLHL